MKPLPKGKYDIELHVPGYGREFLNYWDWYAGIDVVCQIRDGKLFLNPATPEEKEITFPEFLILVRATINNRK